MTNKSKIVKHLVIIIWVGIVTLACQEDDTSDFTFPLEEGAYQGVFYRSSPNARWATADVTLTFEDGRFSGSSDSEKYPAICEGTYQVVGSEKVNFENSCAWTADFDWTFILDGEFNISEEDQKLVISREYEGSVVDTYELEPK